MTFSGSSGFVLQAQELGRKPNQGEPKMNIKNIFAGAVAFTLVGSMALAPMNSYAQNADTHRQQTKNTWRNVGIGSAAVGVYGLLSHQSNLALLGAAGAAYSASRYEHDRKSQRAIRDRAAWRSSHRTSRFALHRHHPKRHRRHHRS